MVCSSNGRHDGVTLAGIIAAALVMLATCGRTGIGPGADADSRMRADGGNSDRPHRIEEPPCEPAPEICNGVDDNCDGVVDEDIAPIACPGGGNRYCVAGRMSDCPRRCEACLPASQRICFTTTCTYWGVQTCAADGLSFGRCRETRPPFECAEIARSQQPSPELERCCLDHGNCCRDDFDLDGDGDRDEMLGRCETVQCTP